MTITPNLNNSLAMQNNSLKKEDLDKNIETLNTQISKEPKVEAKMNYYNNFLGTNLDIKV